MMSCVAMALGPEVTLEVTCIMFPYMPLVSPFSQPFWVLWGHWCSWFPFPLCWDVQDVGHPWDHCQGHSLSQGSSFSHGQFTFVAPC